MSRRSEQLPPPLPPETRTVGQLVAETIKLYQRRFWPSLALGASTAVVTGIAANLPRPEAFIVPIAGAPLVTASYIGACVIALDVRPDRRALLTALAAGVLVFVPFPLLASAFILPGLAWLAFVGLAVPVAVEVAAEVAKVLPRLPLCEAILSELPDMDRIYLDPPLVRSAIRKHFADLSVAAVRRALKAGYVERGPHGTFDFDEEAAAQAVMRLLRKE